MDMAVWGPMAPKHCPDRAPLVETQLALIDPDSISADQLQGNNDITGGGCWEGVV